MKQPFYARFSLPILMLFAFLVPLVIQSAQRAMEHSSNRVEDWLPEAFEATQRIHWFNDHFVSDSTLMISWEGCSLTDQRVTRLAKSLRQPISVGEREPILLVREVLTAPELLAQLQNEPLNLSRRAALKRLQGWIIGKDSEQTAVVVMLSEAGMENREEFFDEIYRIATKAVGVELDDLYIAGTTLDAVAIDQASRKDLALMMSASYVVSCLLMILLFRSTVLMVSVFITSIFCQQMSIALVESTGGHMDSVMLMIPSLLYVLSVSASVHLVNYYRDDFASGSPETSVSRAVRHAISPCGLAAVTTALGLGSLGVSVLSPVRNFGLYAAFGVLVAVLVVFWLLPAMLQLFAVPRAKQAFAEKEPESEGSRWDLLLNQVGQYRVAVLLLGSLLLGVSIWGMTQIHSSARVHDLFPNYAKIIRDYDKLEERIGPLVPLEVVIRLPRESEDGQRVSNLNRMRIVGAIHGTIEKQEGVGAVLSALNFAPPITRRQRGAMAAARESVLNDQLTKNLEQFERMGFLKRTDTEELWRISTRANAGDRLDYSVLLNRLETAVTPVLDRNKDVGLGEISAVYCGGVPLVQQTQQQMIYDLINSFVLAFVMITVMMVGLMIVGSLGELSRLASLGAKLLWGTRRVLAGLVAMVPNLVPCFIVLGGMGLAGMNLGIGSIMTASVALGIAVDDTLHFITWFQRGMQSGQTREQAVRFAIHRCATAMTQTSLICGLGMLCFAASDFVPIARFAWIMFAMLFMALWADLILLPAVLLSPLGKLFEPIPNRLQS